MLAAAAAGDAAAALAAMRPLLRTPCAADAVIRILGAALDLDHAGFVQAAAALAMAAEMPVPRRIHAAWRLALAGKGEAAMAVLLSDPRILSDTARLKQVIVTLQKVQTRPDPASLAHHQARHLARRLLPMAPAPAIPADCGFAGAPAAAPRLLGAAVALHDAPLLPALLHAEAAEVLDAFDRQVAASPFPGVRIFPDVFVNRLGQIWGQDGTVFRSFNTPVPPASRQAEAAAPRIEAAALAIETHNNIYHWLAECYPSLAWCLDGEAGGIPLLVRDDAARFVTESLTLGAAAPPVLIEAGDAVLVRRLYVPDRGVPLLARPDAVGAPFARLRDRAMAQAGGGAGRDLYISRRDSRKRTLANEAALEDALARRGFDIAVMSQLPFAEQVARVSAARRIVAPHGAGLALLAAAAPGRQVMEVLPAMRGAMQLRTCMARISRIVGHEHHLWLEPEPVGGAPWSLSLDPFLAALDALPAVFAPQSAGR